jgi:hypothetical protein
MSRARRTLTIVVRQDVGEGVLFNTAYLPALAEYEAALKAGKLGHSSPEFFEASNGVRFEMAHRTGLGELDSVRELGLQTRTVNCLLSEGITTVAALVTWTETKLLLTPNLGRKALNEIKDALQAEGLVLAKEPKVEQPPLCEVCRMRHWPGAGHRYTDEESRRLTMLATDPGMVAELLARVIELEKRVQQMAVATVGMV